MVEVKATQQGGLHAFQGLRREGGRERGRNVTTVYLASLPAHAKGRREGGGGGRREGGRKGGREGTYLDVRVKSRIGFRTLIDGKKDPLQIIHLLLFLLLPPFLPPFLGAFDRGGRDGGREDEMVEGGVEGLDETLCERTEGFDQEGAFARRALDLDLRKGGREGGRVRWRFALIGGREGGRVGGREGVPSILGNPARPYSSVSPHVSDNTNPKEGGREIGREGGREGATTLLPLQVIPQDHTGEHHPK